MKKINVAELLKDCPTGMELDCLMYDNVTLDHVSIDGDYPIKIVTQNGFSTKLTKYGQNVSIGEAKCVIFPKGETTWEGFQRPFKDGDIVFYNDTIAIFKEWGDETLFRTYVTTYLCCDSFIDIRVPLFGKSVRKEIRFATEEEKQKLFKAIKDNGYKWNEKTNTLEKLIEPIFKKGDKVRVKNGVSEPRIIDDVCDRFYTLVPIGSIYFIDQHNWELVPDKSVEPKFKVGDRITNGKASITIGYIDNEYYYEIGRNVANRLFIKNQDDWELVPDRFDISTLKPFESRVLVRDRDEDAWRASFWGCLMKNRHGYNYDTTRGYSKQCIPYEGNEHLLGKTEDCDDFYKTW